MALCSNINIQVYFGAAQIEQMVDEIMDKEVSAK
jgi:hypothetical protein